MRAIRYHEHGGPEVLQADEIDRPEPGPGTVLVEIHAASVNPVDVKLREGVFGDLSLPAIPGGDAAGVIAAVGDDVEGFAIEDRVFLGGIGQQEVGTFAEYVAVPTMKVAHLPDATSFEEGAALPNVGATAWTALFDLAGLEPTDYCLVHGAGGGVGHVAVQLAAVVGANPIGTVGTREARDWVKGIGAAVAFNYDSDTLAADVRDVTGGDGVDVILDHRLDDYLELDLDVAAQGGRVVTVAGDVATTTGASLRNKELSVRGMSMGNRPERQSLLRKLTGLLERGTLYSVVADTYDLADAAKAHRTVVDGGYVGKLVVRL